MPSDHLPADPPDGDHHALGLAHGYPPCCVRYYCELLAAGAEQPNEEDCRRRGVDPAADWLADPCEHVKCTDCRHPHR